MGVAERDTIHTVVDVLVVGGIFREVLDGDWKPRLRYGGSGFTASIAAARLGARVALASYVGRDDEATVRDELGAAGVNDRAVITVNGASGTFVFPTVQNADRPWPMYRPAEGIPTGPPREVPRAVVIVAFGVPDYDPIAAGWLAAAGGEATVVWDRQGWLSRARDAARVLTLRATRRIYLANEREAMDDAHASTLNEVLAIQPPDGFEAAVIKRGIEGVIVFERSEKKVRANAVRSFPIFATSTVGTGDIFAGALAARLARGSSLSEAARWGCAAAAVALESGSNLLGDDSVAAMRHLLFSSRLSP